MQSESQSFICKRHPRQPCHVTLFRHSLARRWNCQRWVQKAGHDQIVGSQVGPHTRSLATYLRNEIGIRYLKVPRANPDMFSFRFMTAALIGCETMLAKLSEPLVEHVSKELTISDGSVHADETGPSMPSVLIIGFTERRNRFTSSLILRMPERCLGISWENSS